MVKILEKYFYINLKDYPSIGIDLYINQILLWFTIGIIVASFAISFNRTTINIILKKLIRRNAVSEETALTLGELGINAWRTRLLLSGSGQLCRLVGRVGEISYSYEEFVKLNKEKKYKEEKVDFATARFYLRSESMDRSRHLVETGTTSMLNAVLFSVLVFAIYICIALLMPEILTFISGIIKQ